MSTKSRGKPESVNKDRVIAAIRVNESAGNMVEKVATENKRTIAGQAALIIEQWAENA